MYIAYPLYNTVNMTFLLKDIFRIVPSFWLTGSNSFKATFWKGSLQRYKNVFYRLLDPVRLCLITYFLLKEKFCSEVQQNLPLLNMEFYVNL